MSASLKGIASAAALLAQAAFELERDTVGLPTCDAEVGAMLDELAAAEDEVSAHFRRFPYLLLAGETESQPTEESRADWSRIWARRDAAKAALLRYARARAEAAREAAAGKWAEPDERDGETPAASEVAA